VSFKKLSRPAELSCIITCTDKNQIQPSALIRHEHVILRYMVWTKLETNRSSKKKIIAVVSVFDVESWGLIRVLTSFTTSLDA